MPVTTEHVTSECKKYFIVTSGKNSISDENGIKNILSDVDTALTDLEANLHDRDLFFHQICLEITGAEHQNGAFVGFSMGDEKYDPWTSFCPSFWDRAISIPKLQDSIDALLHRWRAILEKGNKTASGCTSEADETQFGQPLLSHLAIREKRFVPHFQNFLRHWDMDHEVEISGAIIEILKEHGVCEETEELLAYCLLERGGFGNDMTTLLLRTFEGIDPKAPQSLLFRRFIILNYRSHLSSAAEGCRVYQARLKSGSKDAEDALRYLAYRPVFQDSSKMAAIEGQIISHLQTIQFPSAGAPIEKPKKGFLSFFR